MGNVISCCLPWNYVHESSSSSQPGPNGDIQSVYTILDKIGSSNNCTVYRVSNKETGEVLACKSIDIIDSFPTYHDEVRIMQRLHGHKNVVQLKVAVFDQEHRQLHIIMELCQGGELLDGVIRIGPRYSEKKAAGVFREIVTIISTCHASGVLHRDIKPENLMFLNMEEDSPIKAIDFGLATFFNPGQTFACATGSFPYYAPEMVEYNHGQEADIWSAGMILCVLLTGFPPFLQDDPYDLDFRRATIRNMRNGKIDYNSFPWSSVSRSAKHLVEEILKVDPKTRISAADILKHPWVREGEDASDEPISITVITRMKRFQAVSKFNRVPLEVIAETISEEEIMGLKKKFKYVDTGNSGTIAFAELMGGLNEWGSELQWKSPFHNSDVEQLIVKSADGRVNYEEFLAKMLNRN